MAVPPPQVIAKPNPGPQTWALSCPCSEILYGGARGGGKTIWLILMWLSHASIRKGDARGLLLRRTLEQLKDFIEESRKIMGPIGWVYAESKKQWRGPDGSVLSLGYLERDADAEGYHGWNLSLLAIDEAGNFPSPTPIDRLRGTLRLVAAGHPPEMRLTANPGGAGHQWLKERYLTGHTPMVPFDRPVSYYDPDLKEEITTFATCVFIPARLKDNPNADTPAYRASLAQAGPAWLVKAWLEGDWDVQATGGVFDVEKVNFGDPSRIDTRVQGWDGAFTEDARNDEIAGGTTGRDEAGRYWLLGLFHGHLGISEGVQAIIDESEMHECRWVRAEGGPSGQALKSVLMARRRDGDVPVIFHFDLTSHMGDKISKNTAFAAAVNSGQVWVPTGARWWPYLRNQMLVFDGTDGRPDDCVDAFGIAFREIEKIPRAATDPPPRNLAKSTTLPDPQRITGDDLDTVAAALRAKRK